MNPQINQLEAQSVLPQLTLELDPLRMGLGTTEDRHYFHARKTNDKLSRLLQPMKCGKTIHKRNCDPF